MKHYLPFIGFGGPLLILIFFQLLFWRGVRGTPLRLILVYVVSVATGILSDVIWHVGEDTSAIIAGIVAPLVYCMLFTVLMSGRKRKGESKALNPSIVAAIIQAVGTVLAAIIARQ